MGIKKLFITCKVLIDDSFRNNFLVGISLLNSFLEAGIFACYRGRRSLPLLFTSGSRFAIFFAEFCTAN